MRSVVPLSEGLKCPHCLWGVFRLRSHVVQSPDGNPAGVQVWYWKCSWNELSKCRDRYYPDSFEMEGRYYAIIDGEYIASRPHEKEEKV